MIAFTVSTFENILPHGRHSVKNLGKMLLIIEWLHIMAS